jgi:hypothetical protein
MMLITPFGKISVLIDNVHVKYRAIPLNRNLINLYYVDGRYLIRISDANLKKGSEVVCLLSETIIKGEIDGGERPALQNWYTNHIKLSIGVEEVNYHEAEDTFSLG